MTPEALYAEWLATRREPPVPYEVWLAERVAALQARLDDAYRLASDLRDVGVAKCLDPETPRDGFLGKTYWQGQKDTARRLLTTLTPNGGDDGTQGTQG